MSLETPETVPIDEAAIAATLDRHHHADSGARPRGAGKARQVNGLEAEDIAVLMTISDPDLLGELFAAAQRGQADHLRPAAGHLRAALHLEPVRERVHATAPSARATPR